MLWTAIGYSEFEGTYTVPFISTFYGSHEGQRAIDDAHRLFKNTRIIAVVAGDHKTSSYVYQP